MSFEPLKTITSRVVYLPVENIDTDRIIPARFLKSVDSTGFGVNLFHDWRYRPDGTPDPDFILNTSAGRGQILLTGKNFGCGSSREHAAWALYQHGFRVIISSGFADIFRTNALNNGLLPLEVSEEELNRLMGIASAGLNEQWTVDLKNQKLVLPEPAGDISFEINPFRRECLLTGSDLIDYLAGLKTEIAEFETQRKTKSN